MKPSNVGRWLLIFALSGSLLRGADFGASVVVVYNKNVRESREVAEHYAAARQVPKDQIIALSLPAAEAISRAEFSSQLQQPLYQELLKRKLFSERSEKATITNGPPAVPIIAATIRYAVLCYGVPLKIQEDRQLNEPGTERLNPALQRNEAAVDSELALLPWLRQKLQLAGPLPNPFYGATNSAAFHPTNGILLVSRLDGPTPEIARKLVDKALTAETNGLWGRAYIDARGITDGNYRLGDEWMEKSAAFISRSGYQTILDTNAATFAADFPMSAIAVYAGWYDGNVSGPLARAEVEFMPGAFAYHLHSFNASTLRTSTTHWTGPLLARGATITFGSVEEPYLSGTPDIATFLQRFFHFGLSFGEAAYAGQSTLSWQTTVIGDPLYRLPQDGRALHEKLAAQGSPLLAWSHVRVINVNLHTGAPTNQLIEYLQSLPVTQKNAVIRERLGDLYVATGKYADGVEAYELALKRDPSPQQRYRLLLTLAALQERFGNDAGAYESWKQVLEPPETYADAATVHKKLFDLALGLGKKEEAAKHEAAWKKLRPPPDVKP